MRKPNTTPDGALACAFGWPWMGQLFWCPWCEAEADRLDQEFQAAVARGEMDAQGYTPNDRRAQKRKGTV